MTFFFSINKSSLPVQSHDILNAGYLQYVYFTYCYLYIISGDICEYVFFSFSKIVLGYPQGKCMSERFIALNVKPWHDLFEIVLEIVNNKWEWWGFLPLRIVKCTRSSIHLFGSFFVSHCHRSIRRIIITRLTKQRCADRITVIVCFNLICTWKH